MANNENKTQELGRVTVVYHHEDGTVEVDEQVTPIYRNRKGKPVTPEMRKAIEDRREAYLAELRARIGPRKSGKAKPASRKRAA